MHLPRQAVAVRNVGALRHNMSGQSAQSFETVTLPASKHNRVITCSAVDKFPVLTALVIGRGFLRASHRHRLRRVLRSCTGRIRPPMSERMPSAITMIELHWRVFVFLKHEPQVGDDFDHTRSSVARPGQWRRPAPSPQAQRVCAYVATLPA